MMILDQNNFPRNRLRYTMIGYSLQNWYPPKSTLAKGRLFLEVLTRRCCLGMVIYCLLMGGCSRNLSRSRAAAIISEHPAFQLPITTEVVVGELWLDWRSFTTTYSYKKWLKNGVITVRPTNETYVYLWEYRRHIVELAPAVASEAKNWQRLDLSHDNRYPDDGGKYGFYSYGQRHSKPVVYRVPLAFRRLEDITGLVSKEEKSTYIATFQYRLDPTPNARYFPDELPQPLRGREGEALLRLWDDGWRLEKLHLN